MCKNKRFCLQPCLYCSIQQVTCLSCKHKSNTVEPFWDLSLEFPERYHSIAKGSAYQRSCTLTEMLAKFTETEALEGNIYACNHCNSKCGTLSRRRHLPAQSGALRRRLVTLFHSIYDASTTHQRFLTISPFDRLHCNCFSNFYCCLGLL